MGKNTLKLGEFFFRYRGFTPIPLVLVILYLAHPTATSFQWGIFFMVVGETIRLWGVSYAGGATRTRNVGAPKLVTSGPFAHVRNPLYIGNMIMYTGAAILTNFALPYLVFLVWVYFGFQYYWIVRLEETKLLELFGEKYRQYCQHVPRFLPRWHPYQSGHTVTPDFREALRSEKSTFLSFFAILIVFYLKMKYFG